MTMNSKNVIQQKGLPSAKQITRFLSKIDTSAGEDACHPWTAGGGGEGYGSFNWTVGGKPYIMQSHRFMFFLCREEVYSFEDMPEAVCHICDNPPCCNPRHLWGGTRTENNADMIEKGRSRASRQGEKNGRSKLSSFDVSFIRNSKQPAKTLAKVFNLHIGTVYRIKNGQRWTHVS